MPVQPADVQGGVLDTFPTNNAGVSIPANTTLNGGYVPYGGPSNQETVLVTSANLAGVVTVDTASQPGSVRYQITTGGSAINGAAWVKLIIQAAPKLVRVATTGAAGVALVNGTPTILTYTAPNDGNLHVIQVQAQLVVTTLEVGGQVQVTSGGAAAQTIFAAAKAAGTYNAPDASQPQTNDFILQPGQTVTLTQSSALTGGAATVFAEIWST